MHVFAQHRNVEADVAAAARLPDIKAHVTYRVVGMEHRWTVSLWDESSIPRSRRHKRWGMGHVAQLVAERSEISWPCI